MRAAEFLNEISNPSELPPKPGEPEFEKSKLYFISVINQAIKSFNKDLNTLKIAHPSEYANLINNSGEKNNRLYNDVVNALFAKSAGNLLQKDKEKLFSIFASQPTIATSSSSSNQSSTQAANKQPSWKEIQAQKFAAIKAKNNTPTTTTISMGSKPEEKQKINQPKSNKITTSKKTGAVLPPIIIGGEKIKPDDPRYAKIMKSKKQESINESINLTNSKDIEKLAELTTELWYANRYTKKTNPKLFAQLSGQTNNFSTSVGTDDQRILKNVVNVDPREPGFLQAFLNKVPNKEEYLNFLNLMKNRYKKEPVKK